MMMMTTMTKTTVRSSSILGFCEYFKQLCRNFLRLLFFCVRHFRFLVVDIS